MQHSVKYIGEQMGKLSLLRKESFTFNKEDFFKFAEKNEIKYSLINKGDDFLVSTWHSDRLIKDYEATLKKSLLQKIFG